jgi:MFS transporter, DHA2 family, multidrug resistance protein
MLSIKENNTTDAPRAGRREWIGLAVIALPCLLYSMDLTVLNLALPHLSADLKPSGSELLWIVDIYGFLVAGFLITMGTLGDRIGRRKLLMIGAATFGVTSVIAAFSNSAGMLIATRALLGVAGATLAPSTLSLIRNMFLDARQRTVAIGIWIASYSIGAAIGPLIGGVLLEYFWWGSVFLIGVPVMVLLLVAGPILLPEYKDPNAGKLDLVSAFLSLTSVLSIIFGLKKIAENGVRVLPVLSVLAGISIGIIFIRRQKKRADPMIDLRLFRLPAFSAALAIYTLSTFCLFGAFLFTFQYLQLVQELSPIKAGLWSLPSFLSFVIGSMLAPKIVRRFHPSLVMAGGLALAAIGFSIIVTIDMNSGLMLLVTGMFILSLGTAIVFTLATDVIVGSAPPERAGAASAISETSSELGGALGIAILGSIGTFIYRSKMDVSMPGNVSAETAASAKETFAGAVAAINQLPVDLSHVVLNSAKGAFVSGFQSTALISAAIMASLAILTTVKLRQARTPEAEIR